LLMPPYHVAKELAVFANGTLCESKTIDCSGDDHGAWKADAECQESKYAA